MNKKQTICVRMGLFLLLACAILGVSSCSSAKGGAMITTEPTYTTITEGFDWGPAITKVILHVDYPIGLSTAHALVPEQFEVTAVRHYQAFDYATFSMEPEAKDHEAPRTVTAAYPSDALGNPTLGGKHIALDLLVEPNMTESNPLHYDAMGTGRNTFIPTYYKVSTKAPVMAEDGTMVTLLPTTQAGKTGEIQLIADDFVNNQSFSYKDIDLLYASFTPQSTSSDAIAGTTATTTTPADGTVPLIIWLHGAGEGGTDTRIALLGNKVVNLATPDIQSHFGESGAYILVPQAPTMWMDYDGTNTYNSSLSYSDGHSYYTETLFALITSYVANNPAIDKDRIYIGGCSNGGYMTVNMIMEYPDYFAAAYPVCHGYSVDWMTDQRIKAIADIPIWMTHALTDSVLPIAEGTQGASFTEYIVATTADGAPILRDDYSNALYDRLVAAGADNVHYSRFDKVVDASGYEYFGHMSWAYTLNNECVKVIDGVETSIFAWMAQQSK